MRYRTLLALVASLALSFGMDWAHVPFHPFIWAGLDVAVCLVVLSARPTRSDIAVLALFAPAWVCYFMPDPWRFWISNGVVIAQLLCAMPVNWQAIGRRFAAVKIPPARDIFDDFNVRVRG